MFGAGSVHVQQKLSPQRRVPPSAAGPLVVRGTAETDYRIVTNTVIKVVTNRVLATSGPASAALESENDRLRRELAQQTEALAALEKEKQEQEQAREARRVSWREREARMREEDPEAHAERQQRREDFQSQMTQLVTDRTTFLKDLDTSAMTVEEQAGHDDLLQRVESTWAIIENLQQGGGFPDREARGKLRENFSVLGGLYETERDYVLRQVGTGLGYDAQESSEFSTYMQDIITLTQPSMPHGMMGHMMGGRSRSGGGSPPAK